jgi:hypothetical protein
VNSLTDEEWYEIVESMTDEEWSEMFEQTCRELAADGLIYDTGQRKWSERMKSYQVVWAFVPPKHQQS